MKPTLYTSRRWMFFLRFRYRHTETFNWFRFRLLVFFSIMFTDKTDITINQCKRYWENVYWTLNSFRFGYQTKYDYYNYNDTTMTKSMCFLWYVVFLLIFVILTWLNWIQFSYVHQCVHSSRDEEVKTQTFNDTHSENFQLKWNLFVIQQCFLVDYNQYALVVIN